MTTIRTVLVDPTVTRFYHCISWCVRRLPLLGGDAEHCKQWIEDQLRELAATFAIDVCGFSILDDQFQLLLKLNLEKAASWPASEVVRRWLLLFTPRNEKQRPLEITKAWLAERAKDAAWIEDARSRLSDLGWLMKLLRETIARQVNKDQGNSGRFWEGRYRSVAVLDAPSVLATCVSLDLSQIAAGVATIPEKSPHTSLRSRVDHCRNQGTLGKLREGLSSDSKLNLEQDHWLFPIEDRRNAKGKGREGLFYEISASGYLKLVDWSCSLVFPEQIKVKAAVSEEALALLAQLRIAEQPWRTMLEQFLGPNQTNGSYFGSLSRLNEVAEQRGISRVRNVVRGQLDLTINDEQAVSPNEV